MQNSSTKLNQDSKNNVLKNIVTLAIALVFMVSLVVLVKNFSTPLAIKKGEQKISNALVAIYDKATDFELIDYKTNSVSATDGKKVEISNVWKAKAENETLGTCVMVKTEGYNDVIEAIIAVDMKGEVVATKIISMSETIGIGTKIQNDDFVSQFIGKKGTITATKNKQEQDKIQVISGATKSSSAYIRCVNAALYVAGECMEVSAND